MNSAEVIRRSHRNVTSQLALLPRETPINLRHKRNDVASEFLEDQLQENNSTDLDIICSDGYVQVHRCLLMGASTFLRDLLIDKDVIDTRAITVDDVTVGEMAVMMRLLYTGETIVSGGEDQAVLFNANMKLLGLSVEALLCNKDPENGKSQKPARMAVFLKTEDGYRRCYTDTDELNGIEVDDNAFEGQRSENMEQHESHVLNSENNNEGTQEVRSESRNNSPVLPAPTTLDFCGDNSDSSLCHMNDSVAEGGNGVEICDSETVETEQASNENNAKNDEDSGPGLAEKSKGLLLEPDEDELQCLNALHDNDYDDDEDLEHQLSPDTAETESSLGRSTKISEENETKRIHSQTLEIPSEIVSQLPAERLKLNFPELRNERIRPIIPNIDDLNSSGDRGLFPLLRASDEDSPEENGIVPERLELPNVETGESGSIDALDESAESRNDMDSNQRVADSPIELARKRSNLQGVEVARGIVNPSSQKRIRFNAPVCSCEEVETLRPSVNEVNVPDEEGFFPLHRAIEKGRCVTCIAKIIDMGADVNVKAKHFTQHNVAHVVIFWLMEQNRAPSYALGILNLLVTNGFKLINDRDNHGCTPLLRAMLYKGLTEELLTWFHNNGADFNVEDGLGFSVIGRAICEGLSPGILKKILVFGGDPNKGGKFKSNPLHLAALLANKSAMEILLDHPDIILEDKFNHNPLHFLFRRDELDYHPCLEVLLEKNLNFDAKCSHSCTPLVEWIKFSNANLFPTLMKFKDRLPITQEIASATLTAIMEEIEWLYKFLPSSSQEEPNDFTQFVTFLMNEKDAELQFDEDWKLEFKNNLLVGIKVLPEIFQMLHTTGCINSKGKLLQLNPKTLNKLEFVVESNVISGPVEFALTCFLVLKKYKRFVEMCEFFRDLDEASTSDNGDE